MVTAITNKHTEIALKIIGSDTVDLNAKVSYIIKSGYDGNGYTTPMLAALRVGLVEVIEALIVKGAKWTSDAVSHKIYAIIILI